MISWNRFYDPATGMYLSPDPIGLAGGMNLYAYVQGDPVNWIDPWGLRKDPTCVNSYTVGGSIIGGGLGYYGGGILAGAGGSFVAPGVGTVGGAIAGSEAGGYAGATAGGVAGHALGEALCPDEDDKCEKQLERDNATCRAIGNAEKLGKRPRGAAQRCYSSAMERYGNCLAGRPLGP